MMHSSNVPMVQPHLKYYRDAPGWSHPSRMKRHSLATYWSALAVCSPTPLTSDIHASQYASWLLREVEEHKMKRFLQQVHQIFTGLEQMWKNELKQHLQHTYHKAAESLTKAQFRAAIPQWLCHSNCFNEQMPVWKNYQSKTTAIRTTLKLQAQILPYSYLLVFGWIKVCYGL